MIPKLITPHQQKPRRVGRLLLLDTFEGVEFHSVKIKQTPGWLPASSYQVTRNFPPTLIPYP